MPMFEDARELRDRAFALTHQGRWKDAVDALVRFLKKEPGDLGARQKLAEGLARLGRTAEAVEAYSAVVRAYAEDGFLLKAMALCKHVLTLDPRHLHTQAMLAELATKKRSVTPGFMPVTAPAESRQQSAPLELPTEAMELSPSEIMEVTDDMLAPPLPQPAVLFDINRIPRVPLFGELTSEEFLEVFAGLEVRNMTAGEVLMREGQPGTSMFVVVQGSVNVQRPGKSGELETVATMQSGAFFGEMALMSNAARLATVVAAENGVLLELPREAVVRIGLRHPSFLNVVERFYKMRLLHNVLRVSPLFHPLSAEVQQELVDAFVFHSVNAGVDIIREGMTSAGLYILLRGHCSVTAQGLGGTMERLPDMKEGDVFGEISLFMGTKTTATVRTVNTCQLLMLPRAVFDRLVRPNAEVAKALATLGDHRLQRMGVDVEIDFGAH